MLPYLAPGGGGGSLSADGSTIINTGGVLSTARPFNTEIAALFDVDISTTGTESLMTFVLPANVTRYRLGNLAAVAKGGTAWASASIGLYTGSGATGDSYLGPTALTTLTTSTINSVGTIQLLPVATTTTIYNYPSVYLRVTTGSGQAAGGTLIDFYLSIIPFRSS